MCLQVLYLPLSLIYGVVHIFRGSRNLRDGEIEIRTARHLQAKFGSAASRLLEAATTLLSAGPLTAVLSWLCPMSCCVAADRVWISPLSSYGTDSMGIFGTEQRGKKLLTLFKTYSDTYSRVIHVVGLTLIWVFCLLAHLSCPAASRRRFNRKLLP